MSDLGIDPLRRDAVFSPCGTWRYTLERYWDDALPRLLFVLLNPSTADAKRDDPTNRRGMGFARTWGYGSCIFVNLFAYRTPNPRAMKAYPDPVGPDNDRHIVEQADQADLLVFAWGAHGGFRGRDLEVIELLRDRDAYHLGLTAGGHPKHPLYLPSAAKLQVFE